MPRTRCLKLKYDKLLTILLEFCFQFQLAPLDIGGNRVAMGQELPALHDLASMEAVELVARADDGTGGPRADYDRVAGAYTRPLLSSS